MVRRQAWRNWRAAAAEPWLVARSRLLFPLIRRRRARREGSAQTPGSCRALKRGLGFQKVQLPDVDHRRAPSCWAAGRSRPQRRLVLCANSDRYEERYRGSRRHRTWRLRHRLAGALPIPSGACRRSNPAGASRLPLFFSRPKSRNHTMAKRGSAERATGAGTFTADYKSADQSGSTTMREIRLIGHFHEF
jgi:hypothetical protein